MLFTSYGFIGFLTVLFLLYYTVFRGNQWKLLLAFSYIFYAAAHPSYLAYICFTTLTIYVAGLRIQGIGDDSKEYLASVKDSITKEDKKIYKTGVKRSQKKWLISCLIVNFGILIGVKYVFPVLLTFNANLIPLMDIIIPLGISFYTLQAAGYVIDVYRGTVPAEANLGRLALFVSFFPQLIQGPISRFGDLSATLYEKHEFNPGVFCAGIERIMWGFFKKLVIADRIGPLVAAISGDPEKYRGGYVLALLLLYTIQLYADFTGGIDIVIGIGQSLGITVRENFNRPYFSKTLKEYWRRWHITMCEWFRNYVFYPVSTSKALQSFSKFSRKTFGDRAGKRIPVYLASFIVWLLTGLWHGAGWNFIVWGLLNWFLLMMGEELEGWSDGLEEKLHWREKFAFKAFRVLRTFLLVMALNLFDCYATVGQTLGSFISIFNTGNLSVLGDGSLFELGMSPADFVLAGIGVLVMLAVSLIQRKGSLRERIARSPFAARSLVWIGLFMVILILGAYGIGYDASQFIYNRF
ncbi:MAG: MBOAT family protein [Lachnospiraceae bacterium]|nr:MBOAT family protein [Lachnospiraceae bacterium]